jgi:N-acetylated-alpha-linked acidic dipeptidase
MLKLNAQSGQISGFSETGAMEELKTEKKFDDLISAAHIGETIRDLSSRPHHVGSPGSREVAEKIQRLFLSYGFTVRMDVYQVLFPVPKLRILEMTTPQVYHALLKEPALKGRCQQRRKASCLHIMPGVQMVTQAELVYVNYGLNADYEVLARMGIDVKGKIVIARYGQSWRGIKP